MAPIIIAVEGGIGAGKSTLLGYFAEQGKYPVIYEPVELWLNFKDPITNMSLFELYYKDKARYGFLFQMMILETRFRKIEAVLDSMPSDGVVFCERSLMTDFEIFAKVMHAQNIMTDMEQEVYERYQRLLMNISKFRVSHIIYLRTSPEVCAERIRTRSRKGEEDIDPVFVQAIHDAHERWLVNNPDMHVPVHIIDADINNPTLIHQLAQAYISNICASRVV